MVAEMLNDGFCNLFYSLALCLVGQTIVIKKNCDNIVDIIAVGIKCSCFIGFGGELTFGESWHCWAWEGS